MLDGTVVIVHPNAVYRAGLQYVLGQVGIATSLDPGDPAAVAERITRGDVTAVVVDGDLPGGGAFAILAALATLDHAVPAIAVLDIAGTCALPWGLFQGAVSSSDDGRQVLAALTATSVGGTYADPALARRMAKARSGISLTPRERQVLALTAEGASTRDMATRLHVSTDTAKTHITNTMRKLGVDSRAAAIAVAYRDGLLISQEQFRLDSRGSMPARGGQFLIDDVGENARAVLRYLHDRSRMGLWMLAQHDRDDWVVLQAHDTWYDIKPGLVLRWTDSLCALMVDGVVPRIVLDPASVDAIACLPGFDSLRVGTYMGAPVELPDGEVFGTLCGIDPKHRNPAMLEALLPTVEHLALLLGRQVAGASVRT